MTSPISNLGVPDPDIDLHPPASNQRSYQPQPPAESSSPSTPPSEDFPHFAPETTLHLPSSRQFLTSLITAISSIPLLDCEPRNQIREPKAESSTAAETRNDTSEEAKRKQLLQVLKEEGDGNDTRTSVKGNKIIGAGENVNPLKLVPPEYRHLIITLHVLFPGVVLPALEVLERGLVERFTLRRSSLGSTVEKVKQEKTKEKEDTEKDADVTMGDGDGDDVAKPDRENQNQNQNRDSEGGNKNQIKGQQNKTHQERLPQTPESYLVRSSQYINNHFKRKRKKTSMGLDETLDAEAPGGEADRDRNQIQRYLVSLEAWNCTCAAFAFACVSESEAEPEPKLEPEPGTGGEDGERQAELREKERDKPGSAGWTFGGMTLFESGDHSSVPPVCKHLLACLLADKWRVALGRYVTERLVSREEMAGVVADV